MTIANNKDISFDQFLGYLTNLDSKLKKGKIDKKEMLTLVNKSCIDFQLDNNQQEVIDDALGSMATDYLNYVVRLELSTNKLSKGEDDLLADRQKSLIEITNIDRIFDYKR